MFGYHKFRRNVKNFLATWGIEDKTINFDFKKQNQKLILLANGYTLDINIDLKIVNDKDVFVCNEFFRHSCFNEIVENNNVLFFAMEGLILIKELFRGWKACQLGKLTKNIYFQF
jgi:hypothetical protein